MLSSYVLSAVLWPLHIYQQKHPLNFVFLGLFTMSLSITVGVVCANTKGWCHYALIFVFLAINSIKFYRHIYNLSYISLTRIMVWFNTICSNLIWLTSGKIVLEALILTSAVVACLTAYTFWASKKGKDFSFLGPILFTGLIIIFLTSFIQVRCPFTNLCCIAFL